MYQDLMQELKIHSPKFTNHNAKKRNRHSKDEIDIILCLEKMEPTLPMLRVRKASTKIWFPKTQQNLFSPKYIKK